MHVALALAIARAYVMPALDDPAARRWRASPPQFDSIIKIGRTHLSDATPLTLGQEFAGYAAAARPFARTALRSGLDALSAGDRRHRRRHGASRPIRSSASGLPRVWRARPACRSRGRQPLRRPRRARCDRVRTRRAHDRWRRPWRRSPTTSAGWQADRVPAWDEISLPEQRARQLDHAGQGQPDAERVAADDLPPRFSAMTWR